MLYSELSGAAQAAFAGVDQTARQADLLRNIGDLPGGFTKKVIDGRTYWYYQWKSAAGKLQQTYVGPDDTKTQALMALRADKLDSREALRKQARSAIELGCRAVPPKHGKIIDKLLHHGFFKAGGVLVGTHAYIAYQNILGASWEGAELTLDLDFARRGTRPGDNISLALDEGLQMDAHGAIESLGMGFLPMASGTTFNTKADPELDIDFLTVRGRTQDEPVFLERLNVKMQPLKFMEFSLASPMRATLLSRAGPMVVNLPRPERFAVHKLIVYGERPQTQRTKANKDLEQASTLFDYLLEHDEDEIKASWDDAMARGPGWRSRLLKGWEALVARSPDCDFPARMQGASGIESVPSPAPRPRRG